MAGNDSTDVLMMFVSRRGRSLGGELQSAVADSDQLATEFTPGSFFELEDFSFGGGVEDADPGGDDGDDQQKNKVHDPQNSGAPGRPAGKSGRKAKAGGARFKRYFSNPDYFAFDSIVDEISISRQLDRASMPLLQCCVDQTPLQKAILVKRKFTYNKKRGENRAYESYLRLEFKEPLITSVEWEDGEVVKEKVKFVCRGVEVQYRRQQPNGELDPPIPFSFDYKLADGGG